MALNRRQRQLLLWGAVVVGLDLYTKPEPVAVGWRVPYIVEIIALVLLAGAVSVFGKRGVASWRVLSSRERISWILICCALGSTAVDGAYRAVQGSAPGVGISMAIFGLLLVGVFLQAQGVGDAEAKREERRTFGIVFGVLGSLSGGIAAVLLVIGATTGLGFFVSPEGLLFWVPAVSAAVLIPSGRYLLAAARTAS